MIMTSPPPAFPAPAASEALCCGQGGSATTAGRPRVVACMLCPNSPTYWKDNRADGERYRPVQPLGTDPAQ